jgi:hypothetical protein
MPASSKTLGAIINSGMREVGEPEISAFTETNILEKTLINAANRAVRELVDRTDFSWRLKRTILVTTDDITTESAAVTLNSTTISSVDSAGSGATNWGSATTNMYFRADGTQKSYKIATATSSSSQALETAYLGATSTAIGYRMFQDTYAIADSDFGELVDVSYGDSASWATALGGQGVPDDRLVIMPFAQLNKIAGGDRHRDTSGRPRVIAQIGVDSSNNEQFVLWPFPTDRYLLELWYTVEYTENTTFATVMFANDAPPSAYDFVESKVVAAAHLWDEDINKASVHEQMAQVAIANVIRRENRERIDVGFDVETYRRSYGIRYPTRSGILFDSVLRRR